MVPKVLKSTCRKLWCLSKCKKPTLSLSSFLRYCNYIANLLLLTLRMLNHLHQNQSINLQRIFHVYMQKTSFITDFFLTILQRHSKLVILDNLGMPGHTHLKWQYQFEEAFDVYLQENINFILHVFLEILQRYCKLVILITLSMSGNTNPRWYY